MWKLVFQPLSARVYVNIPEGFEVFFRTSLWSLPSLYLQASFACDLSSTVTVSFSCRGWRVGVARHSHAGGVLSDHRARRMVGACGLRPDNVAGWKFFSPALKVNSLLNYVESGFTPVLSCFADCIPMNSWSIFPFFWMSTFPPWKKSCPTKPTQSIRRPAHPVGLCCDPFGSRGCQDAGGWNPSGGSNKIWGIWGVPKKCGTLKFIISSWLNFMGKPMMLKGVPHFFGKHHVVYVDQKRCWSTMIRYTYIYIYIYICVRTYMNECIYFLILWL